LTLGIAVGAVALLCAVLILLVLAASRWRLRSYDLAALRMAGISPGDLRRTSIAAEVSAAVVATLAGTAAGMIGATVALRHIPLFTVPPAVDTLDLTPSWGWCLISVVVAVVALGAVAWAIGAATSSRARLERLRESL
ncbi:MAG TPA: FtsX-like permease family protein, partial [Marmoricola sp.]